MKKTTLIILLILNMFFWAGNFYAVKIALESCGPMSVAALRFLLGAIVLMFVLYFQLGNQVFKLRFSKNEWWYMFLTSFTGIFIGMYFFNLGLQSTSAINGSLIVATGPAITAILSYFFLKIKINLLQLIAIIISFIGVVIVLVNGTLAQLLQLQFAVGDIYVLIMAIGFSLSQIIVSKYLTHVDTTVMTTITCSMGVVLFVLFSIPEMQSTPIPTDSIFWASILFMGLLGTGAAYAIYFYCVVELGATTSTLFLNLIPLFTVLLGFLFGEQLKSAQLIGGSVTIAGLLLFRYAKGIPEVSSQIEK